MYENAVAIKEKIENFNIMFFGKNMAQNLELNPEDPDPKGTVYRLDSKPISTQRFYQRWLAKFIKQKLSSGLWAVLGSQG